jgi:hypothetical protein
VASALPGVYDTDAGALANTEILTVDASETLERAAQLMVEHQLTHLIVVARARPVGPSASSRRSTSPARSPGAKSDAPPAAPGAIPGPAEVAPGAPVSA